MNLRGVWSASELEAQRRTNERVFAHLFSNGSDVRFSQNDIDDSCGDTSLSSELYNRKNGVRRLWRSFDLFVRSRSALSAPG